MSSPYVVSSPTAVRRGGGGGGGSRSSSEVGSHRSSRSVSRVAPMANNGKHQHGGSRKRSGAHSAADGRPRMVASTTTNADAAAVAKARSSITSSNSPKDYRYSLSMFFMLGVQGLVVIAGFVVMIVVADALINATTSDLNNNLIASEMRYASDMIWSPIEKAQELLLELRDRNLADAQHSGGLPCKPRLGVFDPSAGFFSDASHAVQHNKLLTTLLYSERDSGTANPHVCVATPSTILTFTAGQLRVAAHVPVTAEYASLDALVPLKNTTGEGLTNYLFFKFADVVARPYLFWAPSLILPAANRPEAGMYMVSSAPFIVNFTMANGTMRTVVGPTEAMLSAMGLLEGATSFVVLTTIALSVNMNSFSDIMREITPDAAGAHTTLYDLDRRNLLASSITRETQYYDTTNKVLWAAGKSDNAAVNWAYHAANPRVLDAGETVITTKEGVVVSSYVLVTDTGITFAMVQSVPREHYYGEVTRLRTITIVVGVVAAVLVLAVCLALGFMVRSGLVKVKANMQLAARLKTHRVVHTTSLLTEIRDLSSAFDVMNTMLHAAKAFMPQHMLMT